METNYCPNCHRLLPENTQYCVACDETIAAPGVGLQDRRAVREVSASAGGRKPTRPLTQASPYQFARTSRHITSPLLDEDMLPVFDDEDGLAPELHHVTWQKVVETPSRPPAVHPPRPPLPPQSHPILQYIPYGCARLLPRVMFWLSMIVVVVLVTAGAFGVIGALGRSRTASTPGATLQVNPDEVAVGGTMTVRGSGFSPRAQIGLTRDAAIPVADTNGTTIISSDKDGNFTDTLIVGPDWINGTHTISVEDSVTHRFTSTPMQVTGMGDLQRPAHLRLSVTSLDLGAGDPALNSTQKVELTNLGGGQISWSAKATQSWLTISPKSGTFSSGMMAEVTIAANRAHLSPGSFSDQLLFSSSAGDTVLPVKMSVTALQVQGEAVLQVAPAALSFTARDAGPAPDAQGVAISNPGQSQLHWTAVANAPWLKLSAQEGTIEPSASGSTGVSVDSAKLLPGTYNGTITFSASGTDGVMHSTQSVAVSVTITPGCALAASPNMLTFTAAYQQSGPDAKMLDLSTTNCLSSTAWRASSSASWLTVSQTSGSTPARPAIGVNMAGLQPGTYNGSVMFSSAAGTQQVAVKFILSQPARPALGVGTTGRLNFGGVAGQEDTTTRSITLSNTGSGTLHWSARATTGGNGDWLSLSPGSGSIGAHQSATLTATAQTLADMAPGTYSGVISITATDGQGQEVAGSPQSIAVSKVVSVGCTVVTTPSALTFNAQAGSGSASQDFSVGVAGSCKGSVTVTPSAEANWLSVSPSQATATPGSAANFTVAASASKLAAGQYTGSIALAVNGPTTGDGPGSVGVTLHVTSTTPAVTHSLEVNNSALAFSTTAGHNPAAQSVTISNSNQSAVNWRATTSQAWLAVSPGHGLTAPSGSSTLMVSVDATGLAAKMYTATLTLTPSGGQALVVKVTLKVSSAAPTPAVTPDPTPLPTPTPQLQPTVVAAPTPQATATPLSEPPTPVGISSGPPSPVKTVLPSPNPVPVPTPRPQPTATPYSARPTPTPQAQPTPTVAVQPTSTTAAQLTPTAIAQTYPPAKHIDTSPSPTPTPPPRPILTPTPRPEIRPTPVNEVAPTQRPLIRPTPIPVNNPIPAQRPVIRVTPTPVYNAIPTQRSEIRPTPTAITRTYPPVKHIDAYPSPTPPPRAVPTPRSVVRPTPVNNVVPTRRPVQILTPTPTPEAEIVPTQRPVPSITPTPEAMLTPSGSQHDHKHGGA